MAKATVTGSLEAAERVTVKVAVRVPVWPSVTVASPMLIDGVSAGRGFSRTAW